MLNSAYEEAEPPCSLAIVGAGITGLAAAWQAQQDGLDFHLLEASARAGGVLLTHRQDGFVLEAGPDSFLSAKPEAAELCRALDLGQELTGLLPASPRTWIVRHRRLHPLPEGWQFLAPARIGPALTTPLLSVRTKLLLAQRWLGWRPAPPAPAGAEESVGAFVRRHMGQEVVDTVAAPLLSGVYGGDVEHLSLAAVSPHFARLASQPNLLRALMPVKRAAGERAAGSPRSAATTAAGTAGAGSLFTTLRSGMGSLPTALAARVRQRLRLNTRVVRLERIEHGFRLHLEERNGDQVTQRSLVARNVILALPAGAAASLLAPDEPELAAHLAAIPYSSSLTVNLAWYEPLALPAGYGFLVPRREGMRLLACTFVGQKFADRVPPQQTLLRVFLGGATDEGVLDLSDADLQELVEQELARLVPIPRPPDLVRIDRWRHAMAQYNVGHHERLQAIQACLPGLSGLHLAGNAYTGIGISDCIREGRAAARACAE